MLISPNEVASIAITRFGAMQKEQEFSSLLATLESFAPKVILEIGVGKGGSSWGFSKLDSVETIIGVDLPGGPWGGGPDMESMRYIAHHGFCDYYFIAGDSKNSVEEVTKLLSPTPEYIADMKKKLCDLNQPDASIRLKARPVDFLFIDGDHSYEGVKRDFLMYSPLVRRGGLIAFHDICEHPPETLCDVKRFWDEVKIGRSEIDVMEFVEEPKVWGGIGLVCKVE